MRHLERIIEQMQFEITLNQERIKSLSNRVGQLEYDAAVYRLTRANEDPSRDFRATDQISFQTLSKLLPKKPKKHRILKFKKHTNFAPSINSLPTIKENT